jgi:hypothetical protein
MPASSRKKKQPDNVNEWLENISENDDDYARRFLQGGALEDQEENKDEPSADLSQDLVSGESQNSDQVHFASRMRLKKNTDDGGSNIDLDSEGEKEETAQIELNNESERGGLPGASLHDSGDELPGLDSPDANRLRGVAIKDYFPPPINEKEAKPPFRTRISKWARERSTFQKILLLCGSLLIITLIASSIFILLNSLKISSESQKDSPIGPSYPHPVKIVLPDGLEFDLGLGTVVDGSWSPIGAEWLEGTELPRWVALPWSRGLEEDVRGFNVSDVIQLFMSNSDIIFYRFQSIQEVASSEISAFHPNSTDLLIVLSRKGNQSLLVIVAVP